MLAPASHPAPLVPVLALGLTQTIVWASSIYLPAILAAPIAAELGRPLAEVYAAW